MIYIEESKLGGYLHSLMDISLCDSKKNFDNRVFFICFGRIEFLRCKSPYTFHMSLILYPVLENLNAYDYEWYSLKITKINTFVH